MTTPTVDLKSMDYALWQIRRILEDFTEPYQTDDDVFKTELTLDRVGQYYQPWETAARTLENTEYEVTEGIMSKRKEKIIALRRTQTAVNTRFNIRLVSSTRGTSSSGASIVGRFLVK